ncbi:hypothetical protein B0H13DRAFT_2333600 [Mycena leptocephala]|nr:hypothetical protein B0H13DRAFT_2333600 [Mycena leptocephala]
MQYVERLERYHEVSLEDPMRVVNTSLNVICMKDSWHKYVDRSLVAILPVPNRFLSKEDINFTAKPRFNVPGQPYASMLRPEDDCSEDDYQLPEQTLFERVRKNDEKATAEVKWKQEDGKEAVNAAELITAPGYPKFKKPREEPFNDESQLVLQYLSRGPWEWVREMYGPFPITPLHFCGTAHVFPSLRCTRRIPAPSDSAKYIRTHAYCRDLDLDLALSPHCGTATAADEQRWDLLLGWSPPSVVARQEAKIRRARRIEQGLGKAQVMQWRGTIVPTSDERLP